MLTAPAENPGVGGRVTGSGGGRARSTRNDPRPTL